MLVMDRFKQIVQDNKTNLLWWFAWVVFTMLVMLWPVHHDFTADEGYFAEMSARVLRGERPNVDFATNYLGLLYSFNAMLFSLFGKKLLVMRYGMVAITAMVYVPAVFFTSRLLMPIVHAVVATLAVVALTTGLSHTVSGNWYALYAGLVAVFLLLKSIKNNSPAPFVWIGICLGLAGLMKHTLMIYTAVAMFYMLAFNGSEYKNIFDNRWINGLTEKMGGTRLNNCCLFLMMASLVLIPVVVLMVLQRHLDLYRLAFYVLPFVVLSVLCGYSLWQNKKTFPSGAVVSGLIQITLGAVGVFLVYFFPYVLDGQLTTVFNEILFHYPKIYLQHAYVNYFSHLPVWSIGIPTCAAVLLMMMKQRVRIFLLIPVVMLLAWFITLSGGVSGVVSLVETSLKVLLALPVMLILVFYLLATGKNNLKFLKENTLTFCLFIWGVCLFLNTYPLGVMNYWAYSMAPMLLVTAVFLSRLYATGRVLKSVSVAFALFAILFGHLWMFRQIGLGEQQFPNKTFPVSLNTSTGESIHVSETWGEKIKGQLNFIRDNSLRNDDVFLYHDEPVLYFWTDHLNPTRYSYAIDARLSDGNKIVGDLETHQVDFVLYDFQQNHFINPEVNVYLNTSFKPLESPAQNVLAFKRKSDK